jgi:hypothetical protein
MNSSVDLALAPCGTFQFCLLKLIDPERYTVITRVFNDLIEDFTKSDLKSFWNDFEIFKIILKYGDLI